MQNARIAVEKSTPIRRYLERCVEDMIRAGVLRRRHVYGARAQGQETIVASTSEDRRREFSG
jgi:hypothetical protein